MVVVVAALPSKREVICGNLPPLLPPLLLPNRTTRGCSSLTTYHAAAPPPQQKNDSEIIGAGELSGPTVLRVEVVSRCCLFLLHLTPSLFLLSLLLPLLEVMSKQLHD